MKLPFSPSVRTYTIAFPDGWKTKALISSLQNELKQLPGKSNRFKFIFCRLKTFDKLTLIEPELEWWGKFNFILDEGIPMNMFFFVGLPVELIKPRYVYAEKPSNEALEKLANFLKSKE